MGKHFLLLTSPVCKPFNFQLKIRIVVYTFLGNYSSIVLTMSSTKIVDYTITKPGTGRKPPTPSNKVTAQPLTDAEIDSLLENLTSDEIEKLLEDVDPDDTHMPPSARCTYNCNKAPTGPFNKKKLLNYIYDEAKKTPDVRDHVPHVPGVIRGKKWVPPQQETLADQEFELDLDLGDEIEMALGDASTQDMMDLAGIMGLHSMINQDQYHHAVGAKNYGKDGDIDLDQGFDGITKATPLKCYPVEPPNLTDPVDVLEKIKDGDEDQKEVNLNNVEVSEKQFLEIFEALKGNTVLNNLSLSNTSLTDWAAANLCHKLDYSSSTMTARTGWRCTCRRTWTGLGSRELQPRLLREKIQDSICIPLSSLVLTFLNKKKRSGPKLGLLSPSMNITIQMRSEFCVLKYLKLRNKLRILCSLKYVIPCK